MKKIIPFYIILFLCLGAGLPAISQEDDSEDNGPYVKQNIGLTNFSVLGVTANRYARCIESVNFLDPGKRLQSVELDKTLFLDDGTGYDLQADDGIMTSTELFDYKETVTPVPAGEYRKLQEDYLLIDHTFSHDTGGKLVVEIACDFKWIRCSQGGSCIACERGKWPHGCISVTNCRFRWSFEFK